MCFTVNVNLVKEELERRYGATFIDPDKYHPSYYYHAFAFPEMPVICSDIPDKIKLLKWGLIPSWTRSAAEAKDIRLKTFNARGKSIMDKPSFAGSFKSKRCLVPVKGFFEWQHVGKEKIPWYIYHAGEEIMTLAGLYDEWVETGTGELYSTFTIITTDPNDLLAMIHNSTDRMPAILDRESEKKWLDLSFQSEALSFLTPYPEDNLKAHTISPLINRKTAGKNVPELIKPYTYGKQQLLF
jgi:putative SOS response-associated peptidase YedK